MELSEAFYAGLVLVDSGTIKNSLKDAESFNELYQLAVDNFASGRVKDGDGGSTVSTVTKKISPKEGKELPLKLRSDLAAAASAVFATRERAMPGVPETVYITGTKWHPDIADIKMEGLGGMKDYNSSDVILRSGRSLIGISLKKKERPADASPTLVNTSFATFLSADKLKPLEKKITDVRRTFFANIIKQACLAGGPLADLTNGTSASDIAKLDPSKPSDAEKIFNLKVKRIKADGRIENIKLINLKGTDEIARGGNTQLPEKTRKDFRKFVNESLYSSPGKVNPLFQEFLNAMNEPDVKDMIADALLDRTLKLSLLDNVPLSFWDKFDYDFYLVTGVGNVNSKGIPTVSTGSSARIHSMMIAIIKLDALPTTLEFDPAATGTSAAQAKFILKKGRYKLLDITLRYKGNFSAPPGFLGTILPDYAKLIKYGDRFLRDLSK